MSDPMPAIKSILGMPSTPQLDQATLDAAEQVVRDRIAKTTWASEAATLRRAADAIHKLGESS